MRENEIKENVTYHNGKDGVRSFSSRKVIELYQAKLGSRVSYLQTAGPYKGNDATLSLQSFAKWAKGVVES